MRQTRDMARDNQAMAALDAIKESFLKASYEADEMYVLAVSPGYNVAT